MTVQKTDVATPCRFKGSLFTLSVLQLFSTNLDDIEREVSATIQRAPQFFNHAPIVIDITAINNESLDYLGLVACLKKAGLFPVGVRGIADAQTPQAIAANLAILPNTQQSSPQPKTAAPKATVKASNDTHKSSLVIDQPIRSGQQVYAKECDLIVIAPVSAGAELLADGSIHVYNTLRGRALAGINGDTNARIFCHKMCAELLSIAGLYQLSDDFMSFKDQQHIHIFIDGDKLSMQPYQ